MGDRDDIGDGLGFHLLDLTGHIATGWLLVQEHMGGLMDKRLHHGRIVHVGANHNGPGPPIRSPVGAADRRGRLDRVHRVSPTLDHLQDGVAETRRGFAFQEYRPNRLRDRRARSLAELKDVLDLEPPQHPATILGLSRPGRFIATQRTDLSLLVNCDPPLSPDRGKHPVPVLTLVHGTTQRLPSLEASHVCRLR